MEYQFVRHPGELTGSNILKSVLYKSLFPISHLLSQFTTQCFHLHPSLSTPSFKVPVYFNFHRRTLNILVVIILKVSTGDESENHSDQSVFASSLNYNNCLRKKWTQMGANLYPFFLPTRNPDTNSNICLPWYIDELYITIQSPN